MHIDNKDQGQVMFDDDFLMDYRKHRILKTGQHIVQDLEMMMHYRQIQKDLILWVKKAKRIAYNTIQFPSGHPPEY